MAEKSPSNAISASREDVSPGPSARRGSRGRSRASDGGTSAGVRVILSVLIIGLLAAAGLLVVQQQQMQKNRQTRLQTENRLALLEERLSMTDEVISEADADTNQQISLWQSEISKLWNISNKRNKGWIETNRANVAEHTETIADTQADLKNIKSSVSRLETAAAQQREIIDRLTALDIGLKRLTQQQRDLVDKANAVAQTASSLRAALEPRVRENQQAIAAIDAHRTQVSADLAELKSATADLQDAAAEMRRAVASVHGAGIFPSGVDTTR